MNHWELIEDLKINGLRDRKYEIINYSVFKEESSIGFCIDLIIDCNIIRFGFCSKKLLDGFQPLFTLEIKE